MQSAAIIFYGYLSCTPLVGHPRVPSPYAERILILDPGQTHPC